MDQAVVVKGVVDKAGMVKPTYLFLAFLSRDEAAAYGDLVARAWTAIRDKPHLGASPGCCMLLSRVREAEQLENTSSWPPRLSPSMAIPSAPSKCRRGTTRPRRSMLADKNLRLAAANQAVTLTASLAPHGKLCAELSIALDTAWVMGQWKQRIEQFACHYDPGHFRVWNAFSEWASVVHRICVLVTQYPACL